MTEEEKTSLNKSDKIFNILLWGIFLAIPTGVIGYSIADWHKQQEVIKKAEQKKDAAQQKVASFTIESMKSNNR